MTLHKKPDPVNQLVVLSLSMTSKFEDYSLKEQILLATKTLSIKQASNCPEAQEISLGIKEATSFQIPDTSFSGDPEVQRSSGE